MGDCIRCGLLLLRERHAVEGERRGEGCRGLRPASRREALWPWCYGAHGVLKAVMVVGHMQDPTHALRLRQPLSRPATGSWARTRSRRCSKAWGDGHPAIRGRVAQGATESRAAARRRPAGAR